MDEYKRLMQELPAEFRHIDQVKDARLLRQELKSFVEGKLVDRTEEIERLRAAKAKPKELIGRFTPEEIGLDTIPEHIRTPAQALADKTRIAELEKQFKGLQDQVARLNI
jgi:hypothetical protein